MRTKMIRYFGKRLFVLSLLWFVAPAEYARGQATPESPIGIGALVGEPTGLTAKFWLDSRDAIAIELGDSYFGFPRLGIDYDIHTRYYYRSIVRFYFGPGVAIGFNNDERAFLFGPDGRYLVHYSGTAFGARFIFGVDVVPRPFEIFMEGGPLLGLSPGFGVGFDLALGMRVYL